jgi:hypothetical protein
LLLKNNLKKLLQMWVTFLVHCVLTVNSLTTKTLKMKKIAFVIALGAFAACGTGTSETATADSLKLADSIKTADSLAAAAAADTTKKDTSAAAVDTTKK